jgi:RNA polymerase sigma-70 factor (ECF subfamily)
MPASLQASARLPPNYREALVLIGAEGLSYEEAAAICGTPLGTIKSRVNRGRAKLVQLLTITGANDIELRPVMT